VVTSKLATGRLVLGAWAWIVVIVVLVPLGAIVVSSFTPDPVVTFPLRQLSTANWHALWQAQDAWAAVRLSATLGVANAILSTALGTIAAYVLVRRLLPFQTLALAALLMPLIAPGIVIGVALLTFYREVGIQPGPLTILSGHVLLSLPFATFVVAARLQAMDRHLEEAASNLGAAPLRTFSQVVLPGLWPGLLGAIILSFVISFDEFVVSFFLYGTSSVTLPIWIWTSLRFGSVTGLTAAISSLVIIGGITLLVASAAASRLGRRRIEPDMTIQAAERPAEIVS